MLSHDSNARNYIKGIQYKVSLKFLFLICLVSIGNRSFFFSHGHATAACEIFEIFSPAPGIEPMPPAVEALGPNHCTTNSYFLMNPFTISFFFLIYLFVCFFNFWLYWVFIA